LSRRRALVSVLSGLAVAAATVVLFVVSRGRWSDPLIDSGREWIVPDALASGRLLYRDVVYWFGPFTPYFQAAFLRAFGSGMAALVVAGAVSAAAVLAVLFAVLRRVTGPREAAIWTALAIPALVFMPNAGGALLGMGYRIWHAAGFTLAAVLLAAWPARRRAAWAAAAGLCAALAGLCRLEWGLAAIGACAFACAVRARDRRAGIRDGAIAAAAGVLVLAAGLGHFLSHAGWDAVARDGHVFLTGLPPETRHFLVAFSGVQDWPRGLAEAAYSAATWVGIALAAALLATHGRETRRRLLAALGVALGVLVVSALIGGAGSAVVFSAAPLVSFAGLAAGLWRRRGSGAATLAACGLLGFVLSYRRPFHIGDSAYVAPPLLFALVAAAGLLRLAVAWARARRDRARLAAAFRAAVAGVAVLALAARVWQYGAIEAVPIAGTDGMLSARPEMAREIEQLAAAVRSGTHEGDGLVAFPEGEVLNLLSGRRNPIRHMLSLPGYLTEANEPAVLAELEAARPAAIVIWNRPTSEYDRSAFGEDYGRRIRDWIRANYDETGFRAKRAPAREHPRFVLARRRGA
jgi:hypothetical protein